MPGSASTEPAPSGPVTAVVGLQWGDEGKGKFVDLLAPGHAAVVRFNGGANAGHSVVVGGERFSLHLVPSGVTHAGVLAVIGNGVALDPEALVEEMAVLSGRGVDVSGVRVSSRAHVVMPYHRAEDEFREGLLKEFRTARRVETSEAGGVSEIGTTRRGIGPCYADKVQRATAIRVEDLFRPALLRERLALVAAVKSPLLRGLRPSADAVRPDELLALAAACAERLAPHVCDTTRLLHDMLDRRRGVLFEGANGTLLDVDHGTYPFVTGSTCAAAGIGAGAGVPPHRLTRVVGVMKAYSTRVGAGPMPTELFDAVGEGIRVRGREFGTTTGRPRRVGWLDLVATKYGARLNGVTDVAMTMLDVLAGLDEIRACVGYRLDGVPCEGFVPDGYDLARVEPVYRSFPGLAGDIRSARHRGDLPAQARAYVDFIEEYLGVGVKWISVGPDRAETIEA